MGEWFDLDYTSSSDDDDGLDDGLDDATAAPPLAPPPPSPPPPVAQPPPAQQPQPHVPSHGPASSPPVTAAAPFERAARRAGGADAGGVRPTPSGAADAAPTAWPAGEQPPVPRWGPRPLPAGPAAEGVATPAAEVARPSPGAHFSSPPRAVAVAAAGAEGGHPPEPPSPPPVSTQAGDAHRDAGPSTTGAPAGTPHGGTPHGCTPLTADAEGDALRDDDEAGHGHGPVQSGVWGEVAGHTVGTAMPALAAMPAPHDDGDEGGEGYSAHAARRASAVQGAAHTAECVAAAQHVGLGEATRLAPNEPDASGEPAALLETPAASPEPGRNAPFVAEAVGYALHRGVGCTGYKGVYPANGGAFQVFHRGAYLGTFASALDGAVAYAAARDVARAGPGAGGVRTRGGGAAATAEGAARTHASQRRAGARPVEPAARNGGARSKQSTPRDGGVATRPPEAMLSGGGGARPAKRARRTQCADAPARLAAHPRAAAVWRAAAHTSLATPPALVHGWTVAFRPRAGGGVRRGDLCVMPPAQHRPRACLRSLPALHDALCVWAAGDDAGGEAGTSEAGTSEAGTSEAGTSEAGRAEPTAGAGTAAEGCGVAEGTAEVRGDALNAVQGAAAASTALAPANEEGGMPAVRALLERARLAQYARAFEELGYDDAPFLHSLVGHTDPLATLAADVGFPPGHRARFEAELLKGPSLRVRCEASHGPTELAVRQRGRTTDHSGPTL
jgi:hypothetical protein